MAEILQQQDGIIGFELLINGSAITDTVEVQEISIEMGINEIASATVVIVDGGAFGAEIEPFANSQGDAFVPGNEIEISLGYSHKMRKVFKGLVISQRLLVKGTQSQLIIECKDKAVNLTKGRFNAVFKDSNDSDAFTEITKKYGLELDIDTTSYQNPCLVQYNCSDWDYLVIRAKANNMLVQTYQNKLSIKRINLSDEPDYEIKASHIIVDIDLTLDSQAISGSYSRSSWDPKTQEVISSSVALNDTLKQGNLTASKLSTVLGNNSNVYTSTSLSKIEMEECLMSENNMAVLSKICGTITLPGSAKILAGNIIKLSGFSARFNGNAFVSKIRHDLRNGEWLTTLTIGKDSKPNATGQEVRDHGFPGFNPAIQGTHIGVVEQTHGDPTSNYRVLVKVPVLKGIEKDSVIWARMAVPYASSSTGYFFFPEIGDEVILSFINDDPRFPIIIGSLYSEKNKPSFEPEEKNQFKSIQSKSGINITFDDEDKIIKIETPDKNTVILNDKDKSMSLKDMNNNSLVMNASGITLKSDTDIKLKALGNIDLSAQSNVDVRASSDVSLEGINVTQTAQNSFTAKGNASAEISASGQTTVKGAMVMIN